MSRRNGWFVGGFSTAAAIVVERASPQLGTVGGQTKLVLEGFSLDVASSIASTVGIMLRVGQSSGSLLSSTPIGMTFATFYSKSVDHLHIEGGYFAIAAPTTSVSGVQANMWGHYG